MVCSLDMYFTDGLHTTAHLFWIVFIRHDKALNHLKEFLIKAKTFAKKFKLVRWVTFSCKFILNNNQKAKTITMKFDTHNFKQFPYIKSFWKKISINYKWKQLLYLYANCICIYILAWFNQIHCLCTVDSSKTGWQLYTYSEQ